MVSNPAVSPWLVNPPCKMVCLCFRVISAAGITQVRFLDYAWASWLGMLPGTFAYVYLGSVGKVAADATADVGAGAGGFDPVKVVLYGEQALTQLV